MRGYPETDDLVPQPCYMGYESSYPQDMVSSINFALGWKVVVFTTATNCQNSYIPTKNIGKKAAYLIQIESILGEPA